MGLSLFAPSPYQAAHQNRPAAYIPNAQRDGLLLRIIKMLNDHFQKKKKKSIVLVRTHIPSLQSQIRNQKIQVHHMANCARDDTTRLNR